MNHTHNFKPVSGSYLMECKCGYVKHEITGRVFTGLTSHDKEIR